jgi:hypothetical protein
LATGRIAAGGDALQRAKTDVVILTATSGNP